MGANAAIHDEDRGVHPLGDVIHSITVRRCKLIREHLVPRGEPEVLTLGEAMKRLAPTRSRRARTNVVRAKPGQFIGIRSPDGSNFVIVNPTNDGDVRWLLRQRPDLETSARDVYLVDDVKIERNTVDLPVGAAGVHR